jgi:hypothetical protein
VIIQLNSKVRITITKKKKNNCDLCISSTGFRVGAQKELGFYSFFPLRTNELHRIRVSKLLSFKDQRMMSREKQRGITERDRIR